MDATSLKTKYKTMEFNKLLLDKLGPIFKKYNLYIIEQFENYIKLQSEYITIIIVYNKKENSNTLWIGRNDDLKDKVEIDNEVMEKVFDSNLKITLVTTEIFINNLVAFFEGIGKPILQGNLKKISELEKFNARRSKQYTLQLTEKQNLKNADDAWERKDYKMFIEYLNKIDKLHLPQSYYLKYKMANEKI